MIFALIGFMAASLYFCPESNGIREAWLKLKSHLSILAYEAMVVTWVALNFFLASWYVYFTIIVLVVAIAYPTALFHAARNRAKPIHVKKGLTTLSITWSLFVALSTVLFALGAQPPALPVSLPLAWQLSFLSGSVLFFAMSLNPLVSVRYPTGQLVPETIIKPGHRYLILHDTGQKAISFLTSTVRNLVDSGSRIIIGPPGGGWLLSTMQSNEPRFSEWKKNGRIVVKEADSGEDVARESFSERLSFGPVSQVYLKEISAQNLNGELTTIDPKADERRQGPAQVFLLESRQAPRRQLTEFLRQNTEVELLNLSEANESFSSLFNFDHQRLRGSIILFEYDNDSAFEEAVDKFFAEGMSNAELCALFTTKSSKLYRAIKGRRPIKIVAASSLISSPDELPDGEMQIPDKELGLVAAIVSDFLDNSKTSGASFVFDSITDLIRGERWEQIYAGIRQLIDLLTVPNATAIFLANVNTMDSRFLGALRGSFSVHLRMDSHGLRVVKAPTK